MEAPGPDGQLDVAATAAGLGEVVLGHQGGTRRDDIAILVLAWSADPYERRASTIVAVLWRIIPR